MAEFEEPLDEGGNEPAVDSSEAPEASPAPDYGQLLAEERAAREQLQNELSSARATAEARINDLQGLVSAAFSRPAQPEAPAEPEISDEDLANNPSLARQVARREAEKLFKQQQREVAQVVSQLTDRAFRAEFEATKARNPELYEVVGKDVENYFAQNPRAKQMPNAIDEVYKYYIGEAVVSGKLAPKDQPDSAPGTQRLTGLGYSPKPPAPDGPREPKKVERKLTPEKARLAQSFGMSEEEWLKAEEDPNYWVSGGN